MLESNRSRPFKFRNLDVVACEANKPAEDCVPSESDSSLLSDSLGELLSGDSLDPKGSEKTAGGEESGEELRGPSWNVRFGVEEAWTASVSAKSGQATSSSV